MAIKKISLEDMAAGLAINTQSQAADPVPVEKPKEIKEKEPVSQTGSLGAPAKQRQRGNLGRITISLPMDCRAFLDSESERTGTSLANVISTIIREKMDSRGKTF